MQAQSLRFSELEVGDRVAGLVCAWTCEVKRTKNNDPYLHLEFRDIDLTLFPGRMWETGAGQAPDCPAVVYIEGNVENFRGGLQIRVYRLETTAEDVTDYVPTAYRAISELTDEFTGIMALIRDPDLRKLVDACIQRMPGFWAAPSAINFHGAYRGGLLEHTVNVTRICMGAADVYGSRVNLDLLIAAAMLHDIGKADAYESPENRQPLEHERLLGHVVRGASLVEQIAREIGYHGAVPLADILHTLLSHHGDMQFGAPVEPCIPEALILSAADRMEADVTGCFDHWRDQPGADMWSYSHQRKRWIRRPNEHAPFADEAIDDLPF